MIASPSQFDDPALQWQPRPLVRGEIPLACALVLATEPPGYDVAPWRKMAQRWLASRSTRARRRIVTVRNRGGLIFALFFCAIERLHGLRLLALTELRVIEPAGGRHALEATLDAIQRLAAEDGCDGALIRANPTSQGWGELASGLETLGRRREWRPHGIDWLRPGAGGLAVLPLPRASTAADPAQGSKAAGSPTQP